MQETITSYVGLDIHKDSIAIAIADAGRAAPRFVGTINPLPSELCKTLRRQRCSPETCLLVYEAGPLRVRLGAVPAQAAVEMRSDRPLAHHS